MGKFREWLRRDLAKVNNPRVAGRQIRREPRVLWWLVLYLVVTFGLLLAVLAVVGRLDRVDDYAIYPLILSGSMFGGRLYRVRQVRDDS